MAIKNNDKLVASHYDAVAENYHQQYQKEKLFDLTAPYPANYFRLQLLLNTFSRKKAKRLVEIGVGEGTPLRALAEAGFEVWGFDLAQKMVEKAKQNFKQNNLDPARIFQADIQNPISYLPLFKNGPFDGLLALGVMPHVENDHFVLNNMANLVRQGGTVFIEFRNKIFSLFTFNRPTVQFIINDLLKNVDGQLKKAVYQDLKNKLRMDLPPQRNKLKDSSAPGYDAILSKWHNPFEVIALFKKHHFDKIRLHWYHYHPALPHLQSQMPSLFRQEAVRLEGEASGWRGIFLCSAFVVEAVKQ